MHQPPHLLLLVGTILLSTLAIVSSAAVTPLLPPYNTPTLSKTLQQQQQRQQRRRRNTHNTNHNNNNNNRHRINYDSNNGCATAFQKWRHNVYANRSVVEAVRRDLLLFLRGGSLSSSTSTTSSKVTQASTVGGTSLSSSSDGSSSPVTSLWKWSLVKEGGKVEVIRLSPAAVNGIKNFIASGLAAACSKTLLAPFDTIKTIQQQVVRDSGAGERVVGLVEAARMVMARPKGFLELYAGLGVAVLGAIPSVGLYFGVYSYSKDILAPLYTRALTSNNDIDYSQQRLARTLTVATSAAIGNTVASFSRVPAEVIKQMLQTGRYGNTGDAVRALWNDVGRGGIASFFPQGSVRIQMVRDIPYAIFTLLAYESLREHWVNADRSNGPSGSSSSGGRTTTGATTGNPSNTTMKVRPWRDMVAGGLAGGIGSYLTNPMDVIKTRLQTDSDMYGGRVIRCVKATYAEGGPSVFLRGSVPRLIHKVPANANFFLFYEFFRRVLRVDDSIGKSISDGGGDGVGEKGKGVVAEEADVE